MKLLVAVTVAGVFAVSSAFAQGGCMDRKNESAQSTKQLPPAPTTGS